MKAKPPHRILGIAADADAAEIKRAFRKLAMASHPDRNPDADAAERFKSVRAAYDSMMAALLDGEAQAEISEPAEEDSGTTLRGEDFRRDLELSLEEAVFGCQKTLTLLCAIPCVTCDGSGEYGASRSSLCSHCHGSGRVLEDSELVRCPLCDGRGFITSRACPDCDGRGHHDASRHLLVHVPAGVAEGNELRLAGQGGEPPPGGEPGHLFLRITLLPHPVFRIVERDLVAQKTVGILRWLSGGRLELPLLDGKTKRVTRLPATSLSGESQRFAGLGLPARGTLAAGDLVIHWQPVVEAPMNAEQIALLAEVEKAGR